MASIRVKFDSSNGLQVSGLTISWCRRGLLGKLDPGGGGGGGGWALPVMEYTRRFRPKGVPFSGWRYIKG